jgi:hypothetical protein
MFQEGRDKATKLVFEDIAQLTHGAYAPSTKAPLIDCAICCGRWPLTPLVVDPHWRPATTRKLASC